MNLLFVHQNFPAQFKFLAPALVKHGHNVVAMTMQKGKAPNWNGVKLVHYSASRSSSPNINSWISDFEPKTIRAEACFNAALKMKKSGFEPDLIISHHGWGESLFLKEVWYKAKLVIYCEFFYQSSGADIGFDPEFPIKDPGDICALHLKNLNNKLHFEIADAGLSPTYWQASTFPEPFRSKITVIHDGIDTQVLVPNKKVNLIINGNLSLSKENEVITFVNRNLEPYRGYHIFMKALPDILQKRPNARVLIVGGDQISYGQKAENGQSWKEIYINKIRPKISEDDWRRVHFLGNISYDLFIPLLQLSTVHVYFTYPFVLSWSLLEAMSIGCAIVASDTKPVHEAIIHDKTGRLVDFFDTKSLANEVCQLLEDPLARKRLGNNARLFAQENYDLKTICLPRQLDWIDRLLK